MKHLLFVFFIVTSLSFSQEQNMPSQEEMMKAWMEYMTPGDMHQMMAKAVGEWKTVSKYWMDPSAEPMVSEGTATYEMIMGGRYLKAIHKGETMGMPFEGMLIQGYDNGKKEFIGIWFDSMGTGMSVSKGTYDETNKSINMTSQMYEPSLKMDIDYRSVLKMISDDESVMEMYATMGGKEFKTMEMIYTRIK